MGQRILDRVRGRRREEEEAKEAEEEEEESRGVLAGITNLTIDTAVTEEEAADTLEAEIGVEVEEDEDSDGEEGDDRTQSELGALEFLTQDADPSGTTLVDDCNGFNELSRLAILWTVRHR